MKEFKRPESQAEFEENFQQIKPLMTATMAYYESSRCLFCYDAPCINACPTSIDIPLFIRQINNGNITGAAKTIYDKNYFGNACGKVCPTEVLCEGACVYNEQDVKPIEIGRLQNFATQQAIESQKQFFQPGKLNGKKVAVIGAGPAGISCASELCMKGFEVDVFEAKERSGGLALYGTAPYKIENHEVAQEIDFLQHQLGFKINYNSAISSKAEVEKLDKEYDSIFLGIGLGGTREISINGYDPTFCMGATEFIESLKMDPVNCHVGKNVIVVGGGNTAMDAASESARMGANAVTLVYRRSKEEMKAYDFELDLARSVGVKALFNIQPIEIMGTGELRQVRCISTLDENGRTNSAGTPEVSIPCDLLILATGQEKQTELLDQMKIAYDKSGCILTTSNGYQCSNPKYFAGGDAANGGAEVVNACAEGKAAAQAICDYVTDKNESNA